MKNTIFGNNIVAVTNGTNSIDVNANVGAAYTPIQYITQLFRKCRGNIEIYRKPIMRELQVLTANDNFTTTKLYNLLRKRHWKNFRKAVEALAFKQSLYRFGVLVDPINPVEGQLWYNLTDKQLKLFNGTCTVLVA